MLITPLAKQNPTVDGGSIKRSDQIFEDFKKFHATNPRVWWLFKRFTLEAIGSGMKHYSSDAVCHRIRWHTAVETSGESVKINDHYTAYYARLFEAKFENMAGFFSKRHRKSKESNARGVDFKSGFNAVEDVDLSLKEELLRLEA